MSEVEIPDPLATALRGSVAWMVLGKPGSTMSSKGSSTDDYRVLLKEHRKLVLPFLRQEIKEHADLSVREVNRSAIFMPGPTLRYFATCERGSPEVEVTQLSEPGLVNLYSIGVEPRFPRVGVATIHIPM